MGSVASPIVPPPKGVFVPVPTFFRTASSSPKSRQPALDIETQCRHSIHLAKAGVRGLVLLGSTGEAIHLSRAERIALISEVRKGLTDAGFPDYPIMAGVLTNSVDEVLEWLEDFAQAGAQWGLVLAPGYFGGAVNQQNMREWYEKVAEESPIGILIYHYPGVTNNVQISPETYTSLASHPKIVGCKMSHGNISHHLQVALDPSIDHSNFRLYSGFGQQLFPVVITGGAGVIDGLAAIFPYTVVHLYELATKLPIDQTSLQKINHLQFIVSRAEEMVAKWGIVGIKEGVAKVLKMGNLEGGRLPLRGAMGKGEWEKWGVQLDAMKELEERFCPA